MTNAMLSYDVWAFIANGLKDDSFKTYCSSQPCHKNSLVAFRSHEAALQGQLTKQLRQTALTLL